MRKWLRSFLHWLDTRFPEKIVITEAEFLKLKQAVQKIDELKPLEERLQRIEAEISKLNAHMGFGSVIPKGMVSPFQR